MKSDKKTQNPKDNKTQAEPVIENSAHEEPVIESKVIEPTITQKHPVVIDCPLGIRIITH